ncbi:MAG: riboflavin synthase, partial [Syntrophales bacterium LBB04]|nr:riboflavin synthase [Syntrophales bacterium LBB04]
MFTGIIQGMGTVRRISRQAEDALLLIDASWDDRDLHIGDSVAVNGACLTLTTKTDQGFTAYVSSETLGKTNLKLLKAGDKVNLEKALRLNDFLGGHIVLGHVDGLGKIREKTLRAQSVICGVEVTPDLSRYLVAKGSVAIDGISLTVNRCDNNRFYVNIIPHTAQETTLNFKKLGDAVNIETDILGKYVEKLL